MGRPAIPRTRLPLPALLFVLVEPPSDIGGHMILRLGFFSPFFFFGIAVERRLSFVACVTGKVPFGPYLGLVWQYSMIDGAGV